MPHALEWHWRCFRRKAVNLIEKSNYKKQKKIQSDHPMFKLPNELWLMIFSSVPLESQACLALTCKTLLGRLSWVIKNEELCFPRVKFDIWDRARFSVSTNARNRFLVRLQDRHWAYCSLCMKLHPAQEFGNFQLARSADRRRCMSLRKGGIVDLCPCIKLTFRDKLRLLDHLKSRNKIGLGLWTLPVNGNTGIDSKQGVTSVVHECTITDDPWVTVKVKIIPVLLKGYLVAISSYTIDLNTSNLPAAMEPIYCCPHKDILRYTEPHDRPTPESYHKSCYESVCEHCHTLLVAHHMRYRRRIVIQVARYLGAEVPNGDWKCQSVWSYLLLNWWLW